MAAKSIKSVVDWSFGPGHGPVSGAIVAALGAGAITGTLHDIGGINPWWGLATGIVAAFVSSVAVITSRRIHFTQDRAVRYRALCWLGAGLWSTTQLAHHSWTFRSILTGLLWLALGTTAAALFGVRQERAEKREEVKVAVEQMRLTRQQIADDWKALIARVTSIAVEVPGVKIWESKAGFTLHVILPPDGSTADLLKKSEKALATAANLPPGCNVEILGTDEGRRNVLVRVATVNALAEDQMMPADYSARSIEDDLSQGVYADRSEATINLRFSCCVMCGQTDSGKSNQLNAITLACVRCTDAFVCAIDLSGGGRFPRNWVIPWREGRAPRPAIDWVANSPEEALLMTTALIQVINGRTPAYVDLMRAENVDYLPVSPQVPQIIVLTDEFATLPNAVKANIKTISDTGRGAAVRSVSCSLRATSEYIPRALIVQASERIGMKVTDEAELQHLFDSVWSRGRFDPAATPDKGMGRLCTGAVSPDPFKGWRLEPNQIDRAAIAVAGLRPALDDVSIELADTVYLDEGKDPKTGEQIIRTVPNVFTGRWDRVIPLMFAKTTTTAPAHRPTGSERNVMVEERERPEGPSADDAAADMQAAVEAVRAAVEAERTSNADSAGDKANSGPDPKIAAALAEIEDNLSRTPMPRTRYQQLLREWQPTGATRIADQLKAEGYQTVRVTVQGWLDKDAEAGLVRRDPDGWRWIGGTS